MKEKRINKNLDLLNKSANNNEKTISEKNKRIVELSKAIEEPRVATSNDKDKEPLELATILDGLRV